MKTTKTLFALTILCFLLLLGCSSNNDEINPASPTLYYINFKVNGSLVEFKFDASTYFDNVFGNFNVEDSGDKFAGIAADRLDGIEDFLFSIKNSNDFQINTNYSNYNSSSSTQPDFFIFGYGSPNGDRYSTYPEESLIALHPNAIANAVVRFTSKTSTTLRGTFSGRCYDPDGNHLDITEGEFYVLRSDI